MKHVRFNVAWYTCDLNLCVNEHNLFQKQTDILVNYFRFHWCVCVFGVNVLVC